MKLTEEEKLQQIESLFPKVEQGYPYTKITVKRILEWHNAQQPAPVSEEWIRELLFKLHHHAINIDPIGYGLPSYTDKEVNVLVEIVKNHLTPPKP